MVQGNGEAATAVAPARKKRASAASKSGVIVVSTSKVVSGEGVELRSSSKGAVMQLANAQFDVTENGGETDIELTNEQGRHLIDVLRKFFGGRGTGTPRKSKS